MRVVSSFLCDLPWGQPSFTHHSPKSNSVIKNSFTTPKNVPLICMTTVKLLKLEPNKCILLQFSFTKLLVHVWGREVPSSGSQHYGKTLRPSSWPEMCTSGSVKLNYNNNEFRCFQL
jgi:hypothetical protein